MNIEKQPTVEEAFAMMRQTMGFIPAAIEKAAKVEDSVLYEHLRSRAYAMPKDSALDDETRTLIYLAAALAAGSKACIHAISNKARMQGVAPAKILETFRITRFALATKVMGDAEAIFESLLHE